MVADADCVYRPDKKKLVPTIGRLYVFDKCVAFHSPKIRPSLIINFTDVASVSKGKGLKDAIKKKISLVLISTGQKVSFKRIKDRDRIFALMTQLLNLARSANSQPPLVVETSINAEVLESVGTTEEGVDDDLVPQEEEEVQAPIANEDDFRNLREPTDAELWKALDSQYPLPQGHNEVGKVVLPLSIDEFWDLFHADNGHYTFDKFFQYRGFRQIVVSQTWTDKIEDPALKRGFNGRETCKWKQIKYQEDEKNNPLVKTSDQIYNFLVDHREKHSLQFRSWINCKNVPYADHFAAEECATLVSLPKQPIDPSQPYKADVPSHKCAFRDAGQMVFIKKIPLFQGKVQKMADAKAEVHFKLWSQWAATKIEEHRMTNPIPVPKEGAPSIKA